MGDFGINLWAKTEADVLTEYYKMKELWPEKRFEIWQIEPDRYGNHFVILQRQKTAARKPAAILKQRINPRNAIVTFVELME